MSEQTELATGQEKRKQGPQTYVVQQAKQLGEVEKVDDQGGRRIGVQQDAWVDLATITVPPRTPRRLVVTKALAEARVKPEGKLRVRVLDADSAEVFEPEAKQRDPEWVI
jgi:hypothetical protein